MCVLCGKTLSSVSRSSVKVKYQDHNFQTMAVVRAVMLEQPFHRASFTYPLFYGQVVKKHTPQKQRKGSTSEESAAKSSNEKSHTTVIAHTPDPDKNSATETSDKAESEKVNKEKTATENVKPPAKDLPDKIADKTPESLKKPRNAPSSGKKSKRRLAANFNFN